jgi:hypothetical protein
VSKQSRPFATLPNERDVLQEGNDKCVSNLGKKRHENLKSSRGEFLFTSSPWDSTHSLLHFTNLNIANHSKAADHSAPLALLTANTIYLYIPLILFLVQPCLFLQGQAWQT